MPCTCFELGYGALDDCPFCARGCYCHELGAFLLVDCEYCQHEEAAWKRSQIEADLYDMMDALSGARAYGPPSAALAAAEQRLMDAKMLEDERLDFDHREVQAATKACKVSCVRFIALGFPVLGFPVSGFPSTVHAFSI